MAIYGDGRSMGKPNSIQLDPARISGFGGRGSGGQRPLSHAPCLNVMSDLQKQLTLQASSVHALPLEYVFIYSYDTLFPLPAVHDTSPKGKEKFAKVTPQCP